MKIVPLLILIAIFIFAGWQPALWVLGGYFLGLITAGYMIERGEV